MSIIKFDYFCNDAFLSARQAYDGDARTEKKEIYGSLFPR